MRASLKIMLGVFAVSVGMGLATCQFGSSNGSNINPAVTQLGPALTQTAVIVQPLSTRAAGDLIKAAPIADAVARASTQPGANPVTVIISGVQAASDTGVIPHPYSDYIAAGSAILALFSGLGFFQQKKKTTALVSAASSQNAAVAAGIANKTLVVMSGATKTIDDAVDGHPATDALVDTISAAGGGKL